MNEIENPGNLPQTDNSSTRKQFRVSNVSVARIENAGGMELVAALILNGNTHAAIAAHLGIARSDLSAWVANQNSDLYRAAMSASSESLLDEAQIVLASAGKSMPEVQIAKAIADLFIRRAGIRNAAYRDKAPLVLIDAPKQPPQKFEYTLTVAEPRPKEFFEQISRQLDLEDAKRRQSL